MSNTIKKTGIELIADERRRQIEEEGFDAQHDAQEDYQELAGAAVAYVFGNIDEEYAQELSRTISPILINSILIIIPFIHKNSLMTATIIQMIR